jgi:hypothetical protein
MGHASVMLSSKKKRFEDPLSLFHFQTDLPECCAFGVTQPLGKIDQKIDRKSDQTERTTAAALK